jgi:membrane protease subunit (stomatin/prohibitin family)
MWLQGETLSSALSDGQVITTLNGQSVTVTISHGDVFINDAQVTVADQTADNGVVHVIDAVLMPILHHLGCSRRQVLFTTPWKRLFWQLAWKERWPEKVH